MLDFLRVAGRVRGKSSCFPCSVPPADSRPPPSQLTFQADEPFGSQGGGEWAASGHAGRASVACHPSPQPSPARGEGATAQRLKPLKTGHSGWPIVGRRQLSHRLHHALIAQRDGGSRRLNTKIKHCAQRATSTSEMGEGPAQRSAAPLPPRGVGAGGGGKPNQDALSSQKRTTVTRKSKLD